MKTVIFHQPLKTPKQTQMLHVGNIYLDFPLFIFAIFHLVKVT